MLLHHIRHIAFVMQSDILAVATANTIIGKFEKGIERIQCICHANQKRGDQKMGVPEPCLIANTETKAKNNSRLLARLGLLSNMSQLFDTRRHHDLSPVTLSFKGFTHSTLGVPLEWNARLKSKKIITRTIL